MEDVLKASVEALKQLRAEVHGKLEDRAIDRIDEIIRDLENFEENEAHQYDTIELLNLIGSVIELLPTVGKAIEYLVHVAK